MQANLRLIIKLESLQSISLLTLEKDFWHFKNNVPNFLINIIIQRLLAAGTDHRVCDNMK